MKNVPKKEKKGVKEKYTGNEVKRYLGVLSEDFQGRVDTITEQYHDIKKDIGTIKGDIVEIKADLVEVKADIVEIKADIVEIKHVQHSHTEMIGTLMEDVEIVKQNIEFLKEGLKKKVDYDEFIALERRISALETKVK